MANSGAILIKTVAIVKLDTYNGHGGAAMLIDHQIWLVWGNYMTLIDLQIIILAVILLVTFARRSNGLVLARWAVFIGPQRGTQLAIIAIGMRRLSLRVIRAVKWYVFVFLIVLDADLVWWVKQFFLFLLIVVSWLLYVYKMVILTCRVDWLTILLRGKFLLQLSIRLSTLLIISLDIVIRVPWDSTYVASECYSVHDFYFFIAERLHTESTRLRCRSSFDIRAILFDENLYFVASSATVFKGAVKLI